MASVAANSTKRPNEDTASAPAKKARTSTKVGRLEDIEKIKLLISDIKDASLKAALEGIITQSGPKNALVSPPKIMDAAELQSAAHKVIRKLQAQINLKLKWKNSYCSLKGGGTKGARVEAVCSNPEIFEEIFGKWMGGKVKKSKDGKMSCSFKTDDEVKESQFSGPSYRYNQAELTAPFTASLKDNTITFGFKFTIY